MSGVVVRAAIASDAVRLVEIYNHDVLHTAISFEEVAISAADMTLRIDKVQQLKLPWLVAERGGELLGYAYAGLWRERHAYRFSVESTVYVAHDGDVRGIGSVLYSSLFDLLRAAGYHTVLGVIAFPIRPAWPCMKNLACARWRISRRSASSSANGTMSVTGRCSCSLGSARAQFQQNRLVVGGPGLQID
jgi:L-amino acid N-acyltransferase YncA